MDWLIPDSFPYLHPQEVHIWRTDLPTSNLDSDLPTQVTRLLPLLSDDEQARANRFYFAKDRYRFTVARGMLRLILGRYLDIAPQDLKFQYGSVGKPALAYPDTSLCFNVSHSAQIALYAIAQNLEVGIDVEQVRSDCDYDAIASRFFATSEQSALNRLPPDLKSQGFFNCWTRKEAILKALGSGLTVPLDQFEVSLRPGEPACLLSANNPTQLGDWSLVDLPLEGYAAAVAGWGKGWGVRGWMDECQLVAFAD